MFYTNFFIFFIIPQNSYTLLFSREPNPLIGLTTTSIIKYYNYSYELHATATKDGYILPLHRFIYPKKNRNTITILLMPGMMSSSADWVNTGVERSLAFLLADHGYDVWLGEQRGNRYARKHVDINVENDPSKFYNFSLHEVGTIDLATRIDYILSVSKSEKLFYIGHSQATIDFFILCTEKMEYNDKFHLAILLAPLTHMKRTNSLAVRGAVTTYAILDLLHNNGWNIFLPFSDFRSKILQHICGDTFFISELCMAFLFALGGRDREQITKDFLPVIYSNFPSGTSMKLLKNLLQNCQNGEFRQYDYGEEGNLLQYNQTEPPFYNITKITAPISIYYGKNDQHSVIEDVEEIADQLPNVIKKKLLNYDNFMHLDFLWAKDIDRLLNRFIEKDIATRNKK